MFSDILPHGQPFCEVVLSPSGYLLQLKTRENRKVSGLPKFKQEWPEKLESRPQNSMSQFSFFGGGNQSRVPRYKHIFKNSKLLYEQLCQHFALGIINNSLQIMLDLLIYMHQLIFSIILCLLPMVMFMMTFMQISSPFNKLLKAVHQNRLSVHLIIESCLNRSA